MFFFIYFFSVFILQIFQCISKKIKLYCQSWAWNIKLLIFNIIFIWCCRKSLIIPHCLEWDLLWVGLKHDSEKHLWNDGYSPAPRWAGTQMIDSIWSIIISAHDGEFIFQDRASCIDPEGNGLWCSLELNSAIEKNFPAVWLKQL